MKRLIIFLSILLYGIEHVSAYNFTVDGITYTNSSSSTCYVTYRGETYLANINDGYSGDIVIPSSVTYDNREFKVTAVGENAFYGCTSLASVSLPSTIEDIGEYAFSGCSSLRSVNIPDGIKRIDDYTFEDCRKLSSITLPNSVAYIGEEAFNGCESLSSINFPEVLSKIDEYAFCGTALVNIKLSQKLHTIGKCAFRDCDSLETVVADSLNDITINDEAFSHCDTLQFVKLANAYLGFKAFANCKNLQQVMINGKLRFADKGLTFYGNDSLKIVEINGTCTKIPVQAFDGCQSLETITLPQYMEEIGKMTFRGCKSLKSIELPEGITGISVKTFYGCESLTFMKFPSTTKAIGDEAFNGCSKLDSIVVQTPISIGERSFYGCKSIKTYIHYGGRIEKEAFGGCKSLNTFYSVAIIPPSISDMSFYDNNSAVYENEHITVYVPRNSWEDYMDSEGWSRFSKLFSGPAAQSITLNADTLNMAIGESDTLTVNILPESVLNKHVEWNSDNEEVATVDQNGVVTAKGNGVAFITAWALEGERLLYAYCVINITTTGIIQATTDEKSTYTVYNLQGVCVLQNASKQQIESLPKGFYIVNGKKVLMK